MCRNLDACRFYAEFKLDFRQLFDPDVVQTQIDFVIAGDVQLNQRQFLDMDVIQPHIQTAGKI